MVVSANVRSLTDNWNIFYMSKAIEADSICIQETWDIRNINTVRLKGFNKFEFICRVNG